VKAKSKKAEKLEDNVEAEIKSDKESE